MIIRLSKGKAKGGFLKGDSLSMPLISVFQMVDVQLSLDTLRLHMLPWFSHVINILESVKQ